ncbi:hypothetical protein EDC56_1340 [Sinobacterium caligoides]|uniref:Uncharacterized protein n=1 Tax=Sinobacterium caligoides TaxID=933926 RepID=A0A3N2E126_9GAMM|nr:hypothetical protein EDC56_1340 [Sinobacterium caligoides]
MMVGKGDAARQAVSLRGSCRIRLMQVSVLSALNREWALTALFRLLNDTSRLPVMPSPVAVVEFGAHHPVGTRGV